MREYFRPINVGEAPDVISFINYQPKNAGRSRVARWKCIEVIARNHGFDPNNPDSFDEWDTVKTVDQVGKDFRRNEYFLRECGLGDAGTGGRSGSIQINVGSVAGPHTGDWPAEGLGATNTSIMFQFFVEGAFSDIAQRHGWNRCGSGNDGGAVGVSLGDGF